MDGKHLEHGTSMYLLCPSPAGRPWLWIKCQVVCGMWGMGSSIGCSGAAATTSSITAAAALAAIIATTVFAAAIAAAIATAIAAAIAAAIVTWVSNRYSASVSGGRRRRASSGPFRARVVLLRGAA
jgi:hypothetical protein